jgi:hypothetical protein
MISYIGARERWSSTLRRLGYLNNVACEQHLKSLQFIASHIVINQNLKQANARLKT